MRRLIFVLALLLLFGDLVASQPRQSVKQVLPRLVESVTKPDGILPGATFRVGPHCHRVLAGHGQTVDVACRQRQTPCTDTEWSAALLMRMLAGDGYLECGLSRPALLKASEELKQEAAVHATNKKAKGDL